MAGNPDTTFSLLYDGPATEGGRIDVRRLAPALLGMHELVQEANIAANPGGQPVTLEVRAWRQGSFEVVLQVIEQAGRVVQQSIGILNAPGGVAGATLIAYVTAALTLIKAARGRRLRTVGQPDSEHVIVALDDHRQINVHNVVVNMYRRGSVRRSTRAVVGPLRQPGIDRIRVESAHVEPVTIDFSDLDAFDEWKDPEPAVDTTNQVVLTIAALSFVEGNKWRFRNGNRTIWASIEDRDFWGRVERGEVAFTDGDLLRCALRVRQYVTEDGIDEEFAVLRVLEHIPGSTPWSGPEQVRLPL